MYILFQSKENIMKILEMNATILTEKELLEIDGGNWQTVLGKGAEA